MQEQKTATFNFQNYGLPHESNLNLIGLALSSRKIAHSIPISIDIDPNVFVKQLGPEMTNQYAETLEELWNMADDLGLVYSRVSAEVHVMERGYKILFKCISE